MAGLQDTLARFKKTHKDMKELPSKACFQMNDTHPTIGVAELMRLLIDQEGLQWEAAWDITTKVCPSQPATLGGPSCCCLCVVQLVAASDITVKGCSLLTAGDCLRSPPRTSPPRSLLLWPLMMPSGRCFQGGTKTRWLAHDDPALVSTARFQRSASGRDVLVMVVAAWDATSKVFMSRPMRMSGG